MSKIKRFAEQVSIEMGLGGELNTKVLMEAQNILNRKVDNNAHTEKCGIQSEIDALIANPFEIEATTVRSDGRVEILCYHGTGHPSTSLTLLKKGSWSNTDSVHGCCGCCNHEEFEKLEAKLYDNK